MLHMLSPNTLTWYFHIFARGARGAFKNPVRYVAEIDVACVAEIPRIDQKCRKNLSLKNPYGGIGLTYRQ